MEDLRNVDNQNCGVVTDNKAKTKKMARGSTMGTPPRKRLADVSNLQQRPEPSHKDAELQQLATKQYIDKLQKEIAFLMKLLSEKNKIIDLHGIELQKMKIKLQNARQQNLQLAQANSHMMAELNLGKDRLKVLQHELGCKISLLKASTFVLEDKAQTVTCPGFGNQKEADKCDDAGEFFEADQGGNEPCNTNRKRQAKTQSLGSTDKAVKAKEKVDNKRLCSRRQSARFQSEETESTEDSRLCLRKKSARFELKEPKPTEDRLCQRRQSSRFKCEEPEPTEDRQSAGIEPDESKPNEDLMEIDDHVCPLPDELVHESGSTSSDLSVKKDHEEGKRTLEDETQESRRRSSGRPMRQAVEKVPTYKEVPLNVKMRRPE